MRKLDLTKLSELTPEVLERYASELEFVMKNPELLTNEDLDRCAVELNAMLNRENVVWTDSDINIRYKMLRHTVQNESVLRSFRSTRHQDNQ